MEQVTVLEAKEHLEALIDRASMGETVVIQGAGGRHVTLLAASDEAAKLGQPKGPKFGQFAGRYQIPKNALDPMTEEDLSSWHGDAS